MHSQTTILDGHVHIHDCFDVARFFDQTIDNFRRQAEAVQCVQSYDAAIMLTESAGADWFSRLRDAAASAESIGSWTFTTTGEPQSLFAASAAGHDLCIIAGRQIVTAENLEVLGLGLANVIDDGAPIESVMESVRAAGALCVLPWGFGKWTGRRGKIIERLLDDADPAAQPNIFVGDNSGRLAIWPSPPEFGVAKKKGIHILPGSDPFPFANQSGRAGRYGFTLRSELDRNKPFATIRQNLVDERIEPVHFGRGESLVPFVRNQVAMQLRKLGR